MSKKFRGKRCVYCVDAIADTEDHLFAKEFFLVSDRGHLPKVPACAKCNNLKSQLEHYATTALPFGGCHPAAKTQLETMVPKRLRRNQALHRTLRDTSKRVWVRDASGLIVPTFAVTVDRDRVVKLFGYFARGLVWHHWKIYLKPEDSVKVMFLTQEGDLLFRELIATHFQTGNRATADLGNRTVLYEGVGAQSLTVWRIALFGGIRFGDGAQDRAAATVGVMTGPRGLVGIDSLFEQE